MVWLGLIFGLLVFQAIRLGPDPVVAPNPPISLEVPDPWAESRRSRAILEAQDRAPTTVANRETEPVRGPVRVIDGDTFEHGGHRIRIADIDTPELRGRCAYEVELAARATRRLEALIAAGPFELNPLPSGRDEDRYGRKLRIVTRGGRSLGDTLVAEGLARTWSGRREPWC